MSIYREKGYSNRREYLMSLAEEFEMDYDTVFAVADALGPIEDFDGLVTLLEDNFETMGEF